MVGVSGLVTGVSGLAARVSGLVAEVSGLGLGSVDWGPGLWNRGRGQWMVAGVSGIVALKIFWGAIKNVHLIWLSWIRLVVSRNCSRSLPQYCRGAHEKMGSCIYVCTHGFCGGSFAQSNIHLNNLIVL